MKEFDPHYFQAFKSSVLGHNLRSGEILLSIRTYDSFPHSPQQLAEQFFVAEGILTSDQISVVEMSRIEATESIEHGLSTKANYTVIETEFSENEKKRYSAGFLQFFTNPKLYSIEKWIGRIHKEDLDHDTMWDCSGTIAIDDSRIGIFWINDLY